MLGKNGVMTSVDERRAHVLVVDDDDGIRESLRMALSYEGHDVDLASNGMEGLAAMASGSFDVAIVDLLMPKVDGLVMCRELRRRNDPTPILVLTARTNVSERVEGLDAGADDYLTKPFAVDELLARIRALLRRHEAPKGNPVIHVGDLTLDIVGRSATRGDRSIELTNTEFSLLHVLASHAGEVLTRERLYDDIWGADLSATSRSLDVYVSYLRQKTEAAGEPRLIETVRGEGFTIRSTP